MFWGSKTFLGVIILGGPNFWGSKFYGFPQMYGVKTQPTKSNLLNRNYQSKPTKPNLPNQNYKTKSTKPELPNQTYQTKPTKPNL